MHKVLELKSPNFAKSASLQSTALVFPFQLHNITALRMMQENWYSYYSGQQESSNPHYSESALVNYGAAINTSTFTNTDVPVDLRGWTPTVGPIIGNNHDGSLTTLSGVPGNSGSAVHASYHPATMTRTLSIPLACYNYAYDVHSRHRWSAGAAATADAYAPQTAGSEGLTHFNRSQVPSGSTDPYVFGPSWPQRGDVCHAVVGAPGLAQPTFWLDTEYPRNRMTVSPYLSALPETSASPTTIHGDNADLGNVGPCAADPVQRSQAPSPSRYRRHRRRSHPRPEYVICDKCEKSMRPQSLRRHIREVHEHIKRPHRKPSPSAGH